MRKIMGGNMMGLLGAKVPHPGLTGPYLDPQQPPATGSPANEPEDIMQVGVMVTGYNHGDWPRLIAGDYPTARHSGLPEDGRDPPHRWARRATRV